MKCAIYLRVSGDTQVDGMGFDRQREHIKAFCEARGFEIAGEWREEGVSGKIECEQRPAFQAMLAELLANGCRTIVVEDLSRLARRYAAQEQILLYLCSKEITLWTAANGGDNITEGIQADPTRRLVIGMMGLISQWEREQICAKLNAAKSRIRTEGRHPGQHGYSPDPVKNRRVGGTVPYGEKPGEDTIRENMRDWRELGATYQEIAERLNRENIPARSGKSWTVGAVHKVLTR
jgi:DNA invertase Pin-like site-specific DNA recombinase